MAIERTDNMDKITVIEKRLGIIVGARLRDRNRIENAISTQDRLRGRHEITISTTTY